MSMAKWIGSVEKPVVSMGEWIHALQVRNALFRVGRAILKIKTHEEQLRHPLQEFDGQQKTYLRSGSPRAGASLEPVADVEAIGLLALPVAFV